MAVWMRGFQRRSANRRRLSLPAGAAALRIAQITLPGALFENANYFPPRRGSGLETFQPQILIGSAAHLSTLANASASGQLQLPSLSFAVYSITGFRDTPLKSDARKALWQTFGVPVREVLLDSDHLPVATECEAQEGLHVETGLVFSAESGQLWFQRRRNRKRGTGLAGRIEQDPCPCGRPSPRILDLQSDFHDPLRIAV